MAQGITKYDQPGLHYLPNNGADTLEAVAYPYDSTVTRDDAFNAKFYHPTVAQPQAAPEKKILGLRVVTFWLTLLCAVLLACLIGTGAAVGVVASKKHEGDVCLNTQQSDGPALSSASPMVSSSTSSTSTSSTLSSSTSSTLSSSVPESTGGNHTLTGIDTDAETISLTLPLVMQTLLAREAKDVGCPGSNLTFTTVPGTKIVFKHECGINYPGNDLTSIWTNSIDDCIKICLGQAVSSEPDRRGPCVGLSWDFRKGRLACFPKFAKGEPAYDVEGVESVFLVGY